jgi:hypothetical protein
VGWERGRYYTRSKKVNGRVIREYLGTGRVGQLASELDAAQRERRRLDAVALKCDMDRLAALDADMRALDKQADLVARAALLAAGFHRHNRGEWRRRRERGEG